MENLEKAIASDGSLSFNRVTNIYVRYFRWMALLPSDRKYCADITFNHLPIYFTLSTLTVAAMHVASAINNLAMGVLNIEAIYISVITFFGAMRYAFLINYRSEFKELIDECHGIWSSCSNIEQLQLVQNDKKLRIFFHILLGSNISAQSAFASASLLTWISSSKANDTQLRKLPFSWFVEDVHESPDFEVAFAIQYITTLITVFTSATIEIAAPIIIIYNAGFFKTLSNRLLVISIEQRHSDNDRGLYESILDCIRFHQRIINLSVNTDKLTRILFFFQFLGSGYVLALVGIQMMEPNADLFKAIPTITFLFMQILIYQCSPEFLLHNSEAVSTAAYFVYTPSMSLRSQKVLSFLLTRAQNPIEMTAGGIMRLSLETFGSIISSTLSFFVVLKNFSK